MKKWKNYNSIYSIWYVTFNMFVYYKEHDDDIQNRIETDVEIQKIDNNLMFSKIAHCIMHNLV